MTAAKNDKNSNSTMNVKSLWDDTKNEVTLFVAKIVGASFTAGIGVASLFTHNYVLAVLAFAGTAACVAGANRVARPLLTRLQKVPAPN